MSLIFSAKDAGTTTSGKTLPTLTITRASGDRHNWHRQKFDGRKGVAAGGNDRKGAKKKIHRGQSRWRITYPDDASARRAAIAERDRMKRAPASFDMKLALGRPDAAPECRVTVAGFKDQIDATTWLISDVTHRLDKGGGLSTDVRMELAPQI